MAGCPWSTHLRELPDGGVEFVLEDPVLTLHRASTTVVTLRFGDDRRGHGRPVRPSRWTGSATDCDPPARARSRRCWPSTREPPAGCTPRRRAASSGLHAGPAAGGPGSRRAQRLDGRPGRSGGSGRGVDRSADGGRQVLPSSSGWRDSTMRRMPSRQADGWSGPTSSCIRVRSISTLSMVSVVGAKVGVRPVSSPR